MALDCVSVTALSASRVWTLTSNMRPNKGAEQGQPQELQYRRGSGTDCPRSLRFIRDGLFDPPAIDVVEIAVGGRLEPIHHRDIEGAAKLVRLRDAVATVGELRFHRIDQMRGGIGQRRSNSPWLCLTHQSNRSQDHRGFCTRSFPASSRTPRPPCISPAASSISRCVHGQSSNPVIVPRSLFAAVLRLEGDVGARRILKTSGIAVMDVDIRDGAHRDVDTPEAVTAAGGVLTR